MPFIVQDASEDLRIISRATPSGEIVLHATLIAAGFAGFGWLTYIKVPAYFWATAVLGIATLGVFLTQVTLIHQRQQRLGPVLVYNKRESTVALPRQARTIRAEEVDCICLVTGHAAGEPVCQLQLHARSGERFLLVVGYQGALDQMYKAIASNVTIPVRHYVEGAA